MLLTEVEAVPYSCADENVWQLEDAGIRGVQGSVAGATAGCEYVRAEFMVKIYSDRVHGQRVSGPALTLPVGSIGANDIL
jgi:hypothetical protein